MQRLLISDANILIDLEEGRLTELIFKLDNKFCVPDVLYEEELVEQHSHLSNLGLKAMGLKETAVSEVENFSAKYSHRSVSRNDLMALALARQEQCPLLTGDADLRKIAPDENVEVKGTLWLVGELVQQNIITATQAETAYKRMKDANRRLPWDEVERQIRKLREIE
jgi:predicted nucleic acid-binding protein